MGKRSVYAQGHGVREITALPKTQDRTYNKNPMAVCPHSKQHMRFSGEDVIEIIYGDFAHNFGMWKVMPKCPNCTAHTPRTTKEWNFGRFTVKMYKCTKCGNQFREYFKASTLQFVLSALNGGLGKIRVGKETTDRHKTYQ